MRTLTSLLLATAFLLGPTGNLAARAEPKGLYKVIGVDAEDMLKMREGPGTGYRVILGLPNGAELWIYSCERSGNTSWCKVSLRQARGLKGYVSAAYLQKL